MKTNVFRYSILFCLVTILISQNHLSAAQQPHKQTSSSSRSNDLMFKCTFQGCEYTTNSQFNLKKHLNTHTGAKPFRCTHRSCFAAFADPSALIRHKRTHSGDKKYTCDYCNFKTIDKSHLNRHIRLKHPNKKVFKCSFGDCTFGANKKSDLDKHIREAHKAAIRHKQNNPKIFDDATSLTQKKQSTATPHYSNFIGSVIVPPLTNSSHSHSSLAETSINRNQAEHQQLRELIQQELAQLNQRTISEDRSSSPAHIVNITQNSSSCSTPLQNTTPLHVTTSRGEIEKSDIEVSSTTADNDDQTVEETDDDGDFIMHGDSDFEL